MTNGDAFMKKPAIHVLWSGLLLTGLLLASVVLGAETPMVDQAPKAVMPETVYRFAPAVEGGFITHDFVIRNQGNAVLNVLNVKTT